MWPVVRRWSPTSRLFVVLAVVFGGAAFMVVRSSVARVEALAPGLGEPVPVVVSAEDLTRGTQLSEDMLRLRTYPSAFAPPGAFRAPGHAVGRTLLTDVAAGEPVTETRVGPPGSGPVASLVPPGLRAFAVATALPAGTVRPGDRVDVLATFAGDRPYTETVVSGVEVLLVLAGGGSPGEPVGIEGVLGPTLVLLVGPDQAERLAYARAFADLAVSVVGAGEAGSP